MSNIETVSWPKDFSELKRLDNLLRCGICYDYMKVSMMTSCCHNYCSLCIRKYMQYKSACPTCFEETFEVNLRTNRTLDDIIFLFTAVRDKVLRHLRIAAIHVPKNEESESKINKTPIKAGSSNKINQEPSTSKAKSCVRNLNDQSVKEETSRAACFVSPSSGHLAKTNQPVSANSSPVTPVTKIPSIFYSPKKSTPSASSTVVAPSVPCPVCNVDIPERNINFHLDKCLSTANSPPQRKPKVSKRSPIPKRVYSLMSDKDLRKCLKMYGLNTVGDKKALINRLQRYTVLYNSECDADNPREVAEIIRQVEREEKDEKVSASGLGVVVRKQVNRNTDPDVIEEENKKYIKKNKESFESLIRAMKERDQNNIKPTRCVNRIESDTSEDEDSYCNRETAPILNSPKKSLKKVRLNDAFQMLKPEITMDIGNADEVIEIFDSPDLSNHFLARETNGASSSTVHTQATVHVNNAESVVPTEVAHVVKSEDNSTTEVYLSSNNIHFNGKTEVKSDEESDSSNNSFSLLADVNDKVCVSNNLSKKLDSQVADPDFIVTESELNCVSEDSEDLFVRRTKRQRNQSPNDSTSNRVLRKRTK